jgi:hypothetical protein
MSFCTNCGQQNDDAARVCTNCGTPLKTAPAAESWRAGDASGNLNDPLNDARSVGGSSTGGSSSSTSSSDASTGYQPYTPASGSSSYTPPSSPSQYPTYTPPQQMPYQQGGGAGSAQPMHPAVPAIVSFFLPGIGLLFVPNKQSLGLGIFAGYVVLNIILFILAVITLGIGSCLFFLVPLINVAAGIHSWDEAAKSSNGQFQPILFK